MTKLPKHKTHGLSGEFGGIARLEEEPPVNWLIPGYLAAKELTCFYGQGDTIKSFIALGLSLQLAYYGNKTELYVAAEGASGLRSRVDAWRAKFSAREDEELSTWHYYNANVWVDMDDVLEQWARALYDYLGKSEHVDLVVIDTLSRNFLGDENSAKEMGMFVEGCETIRRSFDTAVLVIHHEGKTTGRDRGSPALRNAMFAMYKTSDVRKSKNGASVKLSCDRMKDAAQPDEVRVAFDLQTLDVKETGEVYQSSHAMRRFPPPKKRSK